METWPDFVRDGEPSRPPRAETNLTGWEDVVFEIEDYDGSPDDFSTAAIAP